MAKAAEQKDNLTDYDPKDTKPMMEKYMRRFELFEKTIKQYPIETNCPLFGKFDAQQVYKNMTQTYPLCHGGALLLAHQFLVLKRVHGSNVEKALYKDMTLIQFFDRISTKRAVVFYLKYDSWLLRNGVKGAGGWDQVGTDVENIDAANGQLPLLADYLSYDELLISAMCGVSSPTHFINNGNRRNNGKEAKKPTYPMRGVYTGLIGARFEKPYFMEYQLMIVDRNQNTAQRGYGAYKKEKNEDLHRIEKAIDDEYLLKQVIASKQAFKDGSKPLIRSLYESFYSRDYFPLYPEVKKAYDSEEEIGEKEYEKVLNRWYSDNRRYGSKGYLDRDMFRRRMRTSIELFLFDSDLRSKQQAKSAFCHLVALGSGFWAFDKVAQDREICKVALAIIRDSVLSNISCVYFAWFDDECMIDPESNAMDNCFVKKDKEGAYYELDKEKRKIFIQFGRRNPADKLAGGYFGECLLCACYAWDGNSFPGNEYYLGKQCLSASGDPAAAACSTIAYSQNSLINEEYVNGANTRFYFFNPQTGKYEIQKLKDIDFEKNKEKWLRKSALSIPYKRDLLIMKSKQNDDNDEKMNK